MKKTQTVKREVTWGDWGHSGVRHGLYSIERIRLLIYFFIEAIRLFCTVFEIYRNLSKVANFSYSTYIWSPVGI